MMITRVSRPCVDAWLVSNGEQRFAKTCVKSVGNTDGFWR